SILRFAIPLTEARGGDETLTKLTPVAVLVWLSFGLGLLAFSAGIGIAGSVYSKAVGCVGVLCAVALFFLLVLCTYYIGTVFMEYKQRGMPEPGVSPSQSQGLPLRLQQATQPETAGAA